MSTVTALLTLLGLIAAYAWILVLLRWIGRLQLQLDRPRSTRGLVALAWFLVALAVFRIVLLLVGGES